MRVYFCLFFRITHIITRITSLIAGCSFLPMDPGNCSFGRIRGGMSNGFYNFMAGDIFIQL